MQKFSEQQNGNVLLHHNSMIWKLKLDVSPLFFIYLFFIQYCRSSQIKKYDLY